jgi:hypothetical protein
MHVDDPVCIVGGRIDHMPHNLPDGPALDVSTPANSFGWLESQLYLPSIN